MSAGPARRSSKTAVLAPFESLLGGSSLAALTGAASKFTGIGKSAASSLIGLLTPAVLGTLRKEQETQGLDASGLAKLLETQKENISRALPPELGALLGEAGIAGFEKAPAPSSQTKRPGDPRSAPTPASAEKPFNWRLVIAGVAAVALASWLLFGKLPQFSEQPKIAGQNLTVGGVDLKSSVQTAFAGLKTTMQGVRDSASAEAALPQLEKDSTEFDKLRDLASKLPVDAKTTFATLVAQLRPSIEELFNKVLAIPGVAPVAKPVIDALRTKLDALSKTESKA